MKKPISNYYVCLFIIFFVSCQATNTSELDINSFAVFDRTLEGLHGPKEEVELVTSFPRSDYKVFKVGGVGSFYIDNRTDLIKNGIRKGQAWEQQFIDIMKRQVKPGTTVVDIGAHIGTLTLAMSKLVGVQGHVAAFEPQKKLFAELVNNLLLNNVTNVTAYRCCLGDTCKKVEMNPALFENEAATGIGKGGDAAEMITLDRLGLDNVSFIKIDVENFEYEVLLGAEKTIKNYRPYMIIEIMGNSYMPVSNRSEMVQKTIKLVEDMGYKMEFIQGSWSDWLATPLPDPQ